MIQEDIKAFGCGLRERNEDGEMGKTIKWLTVSAFIMALLGLPHMDLPLLAQEDSAVRESRQSLMVETITGGLESAYPCRIPTLLVIKDQEDWLSVWNLHHGREAPQHQLPAIDFEQFSVIALFAGRSAPIEAVQIVHFESDEGGGITVHAVELEAGLGCTGPKISKNPFHMVRVPAVKKHTTPSLEVELLSRHCVDNLKSPR